MYCTFKLQQNKRNSCVWCAFFKLNRGLNPWPNGLASQRKFAKPELAYGLAMGGQTDSQVHAKKVVNFRHIELTCDQLVSSCVGWPNGEKLASTCIRIWARPKSMQVIASSRKWGWLNETQIERKSTGLKFVSNVLYGILTVWLFILF